MKPLVILDLPFSVIRYFVAGHYYTQHESDNSDNSPKRKDKN